VRAVVTGRVALGAVWTSLAIGAAIPATLAAQTLDEIVAKHLAVRGSGIAAVESLRMTGKARGPGGREALLVREAKRPGRIRLEFTAQGLTGVYACDGERGWQVSPFDGELSPRPMSPEGVHLAMEQSDIGGPLVDWKAKGYRVDLVGRVSLAGREAWKLKVTLRNGDVRHLYLDTESYLHVLTEATREVDGRRVEMQTTFGDYRRTDGILFPHAIEVGVKGRPGRLSIVVGEVEVNPRLDDARFRAPDAPG
jgi:hypothetical protein